MVSSLRISKKPSSDSATPTLYQHYEDSLRTNPLSTKKHTHRKPHLSRPKQPTRVRVLVLCSRSDNRSGPENRDAVLRDTPRNVVDLPPKKCPTRPNPHLPYLPTHPSMHNHSTLIRSRHRTCTVFADSDRGSSPSTSTLVFHRYGVKCLPGVHLRGIQRDLEVHRFRSHLSRGTVNVRACVFRLGLRPCHDTLLQPPLTLNQGDLHQREIERDRRESPGGEMVTRNNYSANLHADFEVTFTPPPMVQPSSLLATSCNPAPS